MPKILSKHLILSSIAATGAFCFNNNHMFVQHDDGLSRRIGQDGYYTEEEVREFDGTKGKPMFVTFRGGVYDVSTFCKSHPGGDLIAQAAGGDVEPFWQKWAYHYHSIKVKHALEELRVGTLHENNNNACESDAMEYGKEDMYKDDPYRTNEHTILTQKPFCSETKHEALKESYLTSASALYIRNHAPVPTDLDQETHEIIFSKEQSNEEEKFCTLQLRDILKNYRSITITSVLQCAGNRASEDIKATGNTGFVGTPFENIQSGEVGNISWTGVPLKDVLCDIYPDECKSQKSCMDDDQWHVIFEGADEYESSTPLSYILDPRVDCILATKMNGGSLLPDHGFPVRIILPGIAGARSVKWVQSIRISKEPSKSPWNVHYYRKNDGSHIQKLPLNSIILEPCNGDSVSRNNDGKIRVLGVAYSGGSGNQVAKVDISVDNGMTWEPSKLLTNEIQSDDSSSFFGWVRFQAYVAIPPTYTSSNLHNSSTILCRATDESGMIQPETSPKERGYLYNGWHKVDIKIL